MKLSIDGDKLRMTDDHIVINDSVALVDPALLARALNPRAGTRDTEIIIGTVRLGEIAHARSGDKGNSANIGVIAYTKAGYEWLVRHLTSDRVRGHFSEICLGRVERFEMPKVWILNFLLHNALGGGGSRSLRVDAQGKTLGRLVLEMPIPKPHDLDSMRWR